jgi:hypothetical protein
MCSNGVREIAVLKIVPHSDSPHAPSIEYATPVDGITSVTYVDDVIY